MRLSSEIWDMSSFVLFQLVTPETRQKRKVLRFISLPSLLKAISWTLANDGEHNVTVLLHALNCHMIENFGKRDNRGQKLHRL